MKYVGFNEYVKEILKTAEYKRDPDLNCVVAVVPVLPGCMTQGDNFEEARDLLIDAIELWITVGLREGEEMPSINGRDLVTASERPEQESIVGSSAHA
ncbi:MAG: type II toxin-antitoxin system HicB family antitoxin [Thermodesulfobacteriota bacterium]